MVPDPRAECRLLREAAYVNPSALALGNTDCPARDMDIVMSLRGADGVDAGPEALRMRDAMSTKPRGWSRPVSASTEILKGLERRTRPLLKCQRVSSDFSNERELPSKVPSP